MWIPREQYIADLAHLREIAKNAAEAEAAAAPSTAEKLIRLFRVSGKDPAEWEHTDGHWVLNQDFIEGERIIVLHPVRKNLDWDQSPPRRGAYVYTQRLTEGIQVRVKRDDTVEVFRESRLDGYFSPHSETKITGVVPGLFAALDADHSFLPSLEDNAEFRAILATFDFGIVALELGVEKGPSARHESPRDDAAYHAMMQPAYFGGTFVDACG